MQASDIRHEYIDGDVFAMAGAKLGHSRIVNNIHGEFRNHLKGMACESVTAETVVKADDGYFYPDVLVDCFDHDDQARFIETPAIIVEVLSQSTRKRDSATKKRAYMSLPTLREYVLIETDFVKVEVFRKNNNWNADCYFLGDEVTFESIGLRLPVEEVYTRVKNEEMIAFIQEKQKSAEQMYKVLQSAGEDP